MKQKFLLILLLIISNLSYSKEVQISSSPKTWYDAFDGCKPITIQDRDQKFESLNKKWNGNLARLNAGTDDMWLEPFDKKDMNSMSYSATLGRAYTNESECKTNIVASPDIHWSTPKPEVEKIKAWHRVFSGAVDSCTRQPLNLEDIIGGYTRGKGQSASSDILLRNGAKENNLFKGGMLFVKTGDKFFIFADTKENCYSQKEALSHPDLLRPKS